MNFPEGRKRTPHASFMVWWEVSYDGVTKLNFCKKRVKTCDKVYQLTVLENFVKHLNKPWTFQLDSALAHKAKTTRLWLKNNVLDFISTDNWPAGSPDLNPMDYKLWSVLEGIACSTRHLNIESFKRALVVMKGKWKSFRKSCSKIWSRIE